ncbi:MAG TPA: VWA domain-containing protein [Vicinamibacterales bacterium]|nr:VWA domain-containing protein [Vicinamibacterales bacterium]
MAHRAAVMAAVLLVLVAGSVAPFQAAQQFRSTTGVVRLPVIVTDSDGQVVRGLTRDSFVVFEDGEPQQVEFFSEGAPGRELPLRLGLLLDTSGSMELDLEDAMSAVIKFVDACEEASDVTFVDFDRTVQLGRFSPPSYPMLFERIRSRTPGNMTALYDAVGVYLQASAGRSGQHVLILYTDGGDTASSISLSTVHDMLRASGVLLYAVGYLEHQSTSSRVMQQMQMTRLARETGGEAFFPYSADALERAYDRILEEISSRYTLGYMPPAPIDEGFHRVEVKLADPDRYPGVKIRTRSGYHVYSASGGR